MTAERRCIRCETPTFKQSLPSEEKQRLSALGHKRQGGRGLCVNCYVRLHEQGRIGEYAMVRGVADQKDETATRCGRCGIRHHMPTSLCQDCTTVVTDLGELAAWEEPERLMSSA